MVWFFFNVWIVTIWPGQQLFNMAPVWLLLGWTAINNSAEEEEA